MTRAPSLAMLAACAPWLLAGCSTMSGLDGSSSYGCKAPDGITCQSVSGTYHNTLQDNLPLRGAPAGHHEGEGHRSPADRSEALKVSMAAYAGVMDEAAHQGAPLRAAPRILRLWIKSWEDADQDLNGDSLVYVQIDNGRWLIDHVQRQAREPFTPVRPSKAAATTSLKVGPTEVPKALIGVPGNDGAAVSPALRALQGRPAADND